MAKKKIEIIPRGETSLADGTTGRAERFTRDFVSAFQRHDAWPSRARDQWISGTSAAVRHHVDLLAAAMDAIVATKGEAARRTFDDRYIDFVAQLDALTTFSRGLQRKLERLLEARAGVEAVVEAKLRAVSSSMVGMGVAEPGFLKKERRNRP